MAVPIPAGERDLPADLRGFVAVDACGGSGAVLVLEADATTRLHSMGSGANNGHGKDWKMFQAVEFPSEAGAPRSSIRAFALGSLHGAAADSENRLFVWGANRNGELGLGVRQLVCGVERSKRS